MLWSFGFFCPLHFICLEFCGKASVKTFIVGFGVSAQQLISCSNRLICLFRLNEVDINHLKGPTSLVLHASLTSLTKSECYCQLLFACPWGLMVSVFSPWYLLCCLLDVTSPCLDSWKEQTAGRQL